MFSVDAPHFCAAVVVRDGKITEAAPILRYMVGWDGQRFARFCKDKGWTWAVIPLEE